MLVKAIKFCYLLLKSYMSFLKIFRIAGKKRGKYLEKRKKGPALCTGVLVPAILKKKCLQGLQ